MMVITDLLSLILCFHRCCLLIRMSLGRCFVLADAPVWRLAVGLGVRDWLKSLLRREWVPSGEWDRVTNSNPRI